MMKKKRNLLLLLITVVLVLAGATMCANAAGTEFYFNDPITDGKAGTSLTLYLSDDSADAASFTSEKTSVATVESWDNKSVTLNLKTIGKTVITATAQNGREATCEITVTADPLKLSAYSLDVGVNGYRRITVTSGQKVHWASLNEDIATVQSDSMSDSTVIYAKSTGHATITATDEYGVTAECVAIVLDSYIELDVVDMFFDVTEDMSDPAYDGDFNRTETVSVRTGDVVAVASADPAIATAEWTPADHPENGDGTGTIKITAHRMGKTNLTIIDSTGYSESLMVKVFAELNVTPAQITCETYSTNAKDNRIPIYSNREGDSKSFGIADNRVLENVFSLDTSVAKVYEGEDGPYILPVGPGTATILFYDECDQSAVSEVVVTNDYYLGYIKHSTSINTWRYGNAISGKTVAGASVSATIGGKTYRTTASSSTGKFTLKVPACRIGSAYYVKIQDKGVTYSTKRTVYKPNLSVSFKRVYRSSKAIKVSLKNVHVGDKVTIKIGSKTYTKKIGKNAGSYSFSKKLSKKPAARAKIRVTVKNKYGQTLGTRKGRVY